MWARQLSRYSDWLRAGRSRDRIPVGARFSAPVQTGPGAHPSYCTMVTESFPEVKSGRGVTLTPHPLLVPWSRKGRAIPLLPPMGLTACTEPQCLYKGAHYPYLYQSLNAYVIRTTCQVQANPIQYILTCVQWRSYLYWRPKPVFTVATYNRNYELKKNRYYLFPLFSRFDNSQFIEGRNQILSLKILTLKTPN